LLFFVRCVLFRRHFTVTNKPEHFQAQVNSSSFRDSRNLCLLFYSYRFPYSRCLNRKIQPATKPLIAPMPQQNASEVVDSGATRAERTAVRFASKRCILKKLRRKQMRWKMPNTLNNQRLPMHHLMTLNRKRIRMTPMQPIQNAPMFQRKRKRFKKRRIDVGFAGKRWLWPDSLRANADIHFVPNTVIPTLMNAITCRITRRSIRRIWQRTIRRSISKKSRRSESIGLSAVFLLHKLRIISVHGVLSIWNEVALSSWPLILPLDVVYCALCRHWQWLCWYPLPLHLVHSEWNRVGVGIEDRNQMKWNQIHWFPNVPTNQSSSTSVCVPFWYLLSVINTNAVYQWLHRRILLIIGDHLILLCRARNATKCNARTQYADNSELAVSKWWMTWNWGQMCPAKCPVMKWRIFAEHVCFPLTICWRTLLYRISLCVCWCVECLHSILLVLDWSYYNLFGGTFILKFLFNLLCAQTLDIFNDLHILNMPVIHPLVYDEGLTVAMSPLRHPLPPPFFDSSKMYDDARSIFPFWFLLIRFLSAHLPMQFFQVWACCIFSSSYAGLCCA